MRGKGRKEKKETVPISDRIRSDDKVPRPTTDRRSLFLGTRLGLTSAKKKKTNKINKK